MKLVVGLYGGKGCAPPFSPSLFISIPFPAKNMPSNMLGPRLGGWCPLLENPGSPSRNNCQIEKHAIVFILISNISYLITKFHVLQALY